MLALGFVFSVFPTLAADAGPPDEPLVLTDIPEIGRPGGELNMLVGRTKDVRLLYIYGHARLVGYDPKLEMIADIAAEFEVEEGRRFTFRLRDGHRWSDGTALTSEDFRFYWEDVALNEELNPTGPPVDMLIDGERPKFEVLDETSFRYTWSKPNPYFLPRIAAASPLFLYRPAHYLKSFHKTFVDGSKLDKLVQEDSARDWVQLYLRRDRMNKFDNSGSSDTAALGPYDQATSRTIYRCTKSRVPPGRC